MPRLLKRQNRQNRQNKKRQRYQTGYFMSVLMLSAVLTSIASPWIHPVSAHDVQIEGDVAGTWHVEPNDTPKAGEPATVWIALTRRGGEILPLNQANCQLKVFDAAAPTQAIAQPPLQPIDAEQYQGIPSAAVTFPQPGIYSMTLNCSPKTAEAFAPFEMTSEITVATGTTTRAIESPAALTTVPSVAPSVVPSVAPSVVPSVAPQAAAATVQEPAPFQPNPSVKTNTNWRLWVIGVAAIVGVAALVWRGKVNS